MNEKIHVNLHDQEITGIIDIESVHVYRNCSKLNIHGNTVGGFKLINTINCSVCDNRTKEGVIVETEGKKYKNKDLDLTIENNKTIKK